MSKSHTPSSEYKEFVQSRLYEEKHKFLSDKICTLQIRNERELLLGQLRVCTAYDSKNEGLMRTLANWREMHAHWFPATFKVTMEGTRRWYDTAVIDNPDRVLFIIESNGAPVGHIGLYRFDYEAHSCELDNVLRGETAPREIMTYAAQTLMVWARNTFDLSSMTLRVFLDNTRAIALYERLGYVRERLIPLEKVIGKDSVLWEEVPDDNTPKERYYVQMRLIFSTS